MKQNTEAELQERAKVDTTIHFMSSIPLKIFNQTVLKMGLNVQ